MLKFTMNTDRLVMKVLNTGVFKDMQMKSWMDFIREVMTGIMHRISLVKLISLGPLQLIICINWLMIFGKLVRKQTHLCLVFNNNRMELGSKRLIVTNKVICLLNKETTWLNLMVKKQLNCLEFSMTTRLSLILLSVKDQLTLIQVQ